MGRQSRPLRTMTCRKTEPATVASSGVGSVSASYQLDQRWLTRVTWNRIVTRYDRDADVIEAGVGLRSGHPNVRWPAKWDPTFS